MNVTSIQVTLKIISRHALRHLESHFVCFFTNEMRKTSTYHHSVRKRIQNDV